MTTTRTSENNLKAPCLVYRRKYFAAPAQAEIEVAGGVLSCRSSKAERSFNWPIREVTVKFDLLSGGFYVYGPQGESRYVSFDKPPAMFRSVGDQIGYAKSRSSLGGSALFTATELVDAVAARRQQKRWRAELERQGAQIQP